MVREEISIAEKIIKLFPNENIVLNKKFNNRKPDIWLWLRWWKIMTQMMRKKEKTCLKVITLRYFDVMPMILILIFLNF